MKLARWTSAAVTCALLAAGTASAQDETGGSVQLPLTRYEALTRGTPAADTGAGHAFSGVSASVRVDDDGASAEIAVSATARVLGGGVSLVPLAPNGVAFIGATVDGSPAELALHGGSVVWPAAAEGTYRLAWTYRADVRRYGDGRTLSVATPAASVQLSATLPVNDPGVTVFPATALSVTPSADRTELTATVPATSAFTIAWRAGGTAGFTLSRASYRGRLDGETIRFEAELVVELAGSERVLVPLFPAGVALEDVQVDRAEAAIAVLEAGADGVERFAAPVSGRGRHRIAATFRVPVDADGGLPRVELELVPTPVCRFELHLPGERELTVEPHAGVTTQRSRGATVASFHVPMSSHVAVEWAEAIPEDAAEIETRAHAELVHVVRPDEGVLAMTAYASWEISRGATSRVELLIPDGVQVNSVTASTGVVSDWRVGGETRGRVLTVFLDREVADRLDLEIAYERDWPTRTRTSEAFDVPLLRASGVHRQRGMVALLATGELTLEPREEERVSRVGDNLLPSAIRDRLSATVAHTFRYLDEPPRLVAVGAVRAPEPARFDAQIDTLVSLGDVSTSIATLVSLDVKNGSLDTVLIALPAGVNLLEVSAPSLRRYEIEQDGGARRLRVELTQPIQGRLAIEVLAERITGEGEEIGLPFLGVLGAEVERGRIGVEARAAFQIDASATDRLSPVDPAELPEQLLLRTDNPILHAYRYVQADPPPELAVRITRHAEIETPQATIDEASYRTLYTRDGVAVTAARFMVHNRRQQFLRVALPAGSEVWSAHVDGRAQRPALETGSDADDPIVLVNIVSATDAFPVEIVYATPVASLGAFGRVSAELPRLDVVVTRSRWELFLPDGASYASPDTSMTLVESGLAPSGAWSVEGAPAALALDVPTEGVRYVLTQMYAGRNGETVGASIPYASGWGGPFALGLSMLGSLLLCLGLLALAVLRLGMPVPAALGARLSVSLATYRDNHEGGPPAEPLPRGTTSAVAGTAALGALLLLGAHAYLATPPWAAIAVIVMCTLGAIGMALARHIEARPRSAEGGPPAPSTEPPPPGGAQA